MVDRRFLIIMMILCCALSYGFTGNESVRVLTHSTGRNLYNDGGVSAWFTEYNADHGTDISISRVDFPSTPYPWNNYPYDWWNIWINGACEEGDVNLECIYNLAEQYDVVSWKQCYPGSDILEDLGTPDISSSRKSLENYKLQYRALREMMRQYNDTKFIVWTLAPRHRLATNEGNARRAGEFVEWVRDEWLFENDTDYPNIYIFDFWHLHADENNTLKYEYEISHSSSDSHPNMLAREENGPRFAQFVANALRDEAYSNQFSGRTTHFELLNSTEIQHVTGATIDKVSHGRIVFTEAVNMSRVRIRDIVEIEDDWIAIDTATEPQLNASANLTFYNITYDNPVIFKDGMRYNPEGGYAFDDATLSFSVASFSNYSIAEGSSHAADIDMDGDINTTEITGYVSYWKGGLATIVSVLEGLEMWKGQ